MLLSGRPQLIRPVLAGFLALCLADWVLIEDLGFLGGLGTDPNNMIPFALLAAGGYLALIRVPVPAAVAAGASAAPVSGGGHGPAGGSRSGSPHWASGPAPPVSSRWRPWARSG